MNTNANDGLWDVAAYDGLCHRIACPTCGAVNAGVHLYPNTNGWHVSGIDGPQMVLYLCPNECEEWSIVRLGVPKRPTGGVEQYLDRAGDLLVVLTRRGRMSLRAAKKAAFDEVKKLRPDVSFVREVIECARQYNERDRYLQLLIMRWWLCLREMVAQELEGAEELMESVRHDFNVLVFKD